MAFANKRRRSLTRTKANQARSTPVDRSTANSCRAAEDPKHTPKHPGLRKGVAAWYTRLGESYQFSRGLSREHIEEAAAALREFQEKHAGWVSPATVTHLTKISRSAICHAIRDRRLKVARHTLPSGTQIVLVPLNEALDIGRFHYGSSYQ